MIITLSYIPAQVSSPGATLGAPVTYQKQVSAVFNNYCLSCHAHNSSNTSGLFLDTYADSKNVAQGGRLIGALRHQNGYSAMPKGLSEPIDECYIRQVELWIANGYVQ